MPNNQKVKGTSRLGFYFAGLGLFGMLVASLFICMEGYVGAVQLLLAGAIAVVLPVVLLLLLVMLTSSSQSEPRSWYPQLHAIYMAILGLLVGVCFTYQVMKQPLPFWQTVVLAVLWLTFIFGLGYISSNAFMKPRP